MPKTIDQTRFTSELFDLLDETFENHHGIYLDRGTSLSETLAGISADEASRRVGGQCATLAAQVAHVTFYLTVLERYIQKQEVGKVDWGEIWRTVGVVTPAEWDELRGQLKQTYDRIMIRLRGLEDWNGDTEVGGAMAMVVHTAYHLGEIRQALCVLK